jgi:hypothetical protein
LLTGLVNGIKDRHFAVKCLASFVPYSMQPRAWNAPELPVMPWTRSLVFLSTRIDMDEEEFQMDLFL